ncbi:MAG: outer membrane protein assembly factor BamD [Rubellimicrobium sp.]|nr:outer membrane protein assembly factor BamD [Rubellimicrobium sp.]
MLDGPGSSRERAAGRPGQGQDKGAGVAGTGKRRRAALAAVVLSLGLAACGGGGGNIPLAAESMSADEIYQHGEYELSRNRPDDAATYFAEIERLYPYSDWAKRGLVMAAYAYHRDRDYDNARAAAQRYLDFYPTSADAAWAQYLLALSYYDQIDEIGRDQGLTFQALQALRRLIETYPDSEYTQDAILKFDLAFDRLAGKEMEIGRYYLRRGHFTAAINRFRIVVADFQTTSHTPEALYRLIEAYLSLGLTDEAQAAGAILGHNYQSTDWYRDGYTLLTGQGLRPQAEGDNWLAQIYRQMVQGQWL